jgi:hypothetical protein
VTRPTRSPPWWIWKKSTIVVLGAEAVPGDLDAHELAVSALRPAP